jgi:hypothetical protein
MIRQHLCYSSNIIIIVKEEFAQKKKKISYSIKIENPFFFPLKKKEVQFIVTEPSCNL